MAESQREGSNVAASRESWPTRLLHCQAESEVVEVARDYLARLSYYEVLCLPERCRPRKLLTPADVSAYWFDLSHYAHGQSATAARAVERLTAFFAQADSRLTQLLNSRRSPVELGWKSAQPS